MEFDGLLESISLLHDFFVFNDDHMSVLVGPSDKVRLVIKARLTDSEGVHLIPLGDLVRICLDFVTNKFICYVRARTGRLSLFLGHLLQEVSIDIRLEGGGHLCFVHKNNAVVASGALLRCRLGRLVLVGCRG